MKTRFPSISRRNFLQALGIGAAGMSMAACAPENLMIQPTTQLRGTGQLRGGGVPAGVADRRPLAFHRTQVGDLQVTVLNDGVIAFPTENFAVNASAEERTALLAEYNLPTEMGRADIGVILVENGDQRILLDTGVGDAPGMGDGTGRLLVTLDLLGIKRESISAVLFSHFHPDHIGGASFDGVATFPNAQYYFPQAEWDFVQNAPAALADLVGLVNAKLQPIMEEDQLTLFGSEEELVPGIQSVAAFGHSPGHHAFLLASGSDQLLFTADAANHFVLHFQRPDWLFSFDAIPELTTATRQQLLGRAADEGLKIVGTHLPFPGMGYVVRSADGFRFVPQG